MLQVNINHTGKFTTLCIVY